MCVLLGSSTPSSWKRADPKISMDISLSLPPPWTFPHGRAQILRISTGTVRLSLAFKLRTTRHSVADVGPGPQLLDRLPLTTASSRRHTNNRARRSSINRVLFTSSQCTSRMPLSTISTGAILKPSIEPCADLQQTDQVPADIHSPVTARESARPSSLV